VPLLVRADGAGCSKEFLNHVRGPRERGICAEFSVGYPVTEQVREATVDRLLHHAHLVSPRATPTASPRRSR
jgi:hypothetical protein